MYLRYFIYLGFLDIFKNYVFIKLKLLVVKFLIDNEDIVYVLVMGQIFKDILKVIFDKIVVKKQDYVMKVNRILFKNDYN